MHTRREVQQEQSADGTGYCPIFLRQVFAFIRSKDDKGYNENCQLLALRFAMMFIIPKSSLTQMITDAVLLRRWQEFAYFKLCEIHLLEEGAYYEAVSARPGWRKVLLSEDGLSA